MLSTYLRDKFLNYHFRNTAIGTAPATLYFSLHSADPSLTGVSEVTTTYFAGRAAYTSSNFTAPSTVGSNRIISSNASLSLGTSIAATTTPLSYYGIWDAATSGNFLFGGTFKNTLGVDTPLTFGSGDTVTRASGTIQLYLDLLYWSVYARDLQFSWLKGGSIASPNANNYVGLYTALDATNTGTEITATVATGGRFAIPAANWTAPATVSDRRQINNTNNIDFGNAIAAATGFDKVGVLSASTSGNLIIFMDATSQDIVIGQSLLIPATYLKVSLS